MTIFNSIYEKQIIAQDGTETRYKELYDAESHQYLSTVGLAYKPVEHKEIHDLVTSSLHALSIDFNPPEIKMLKHGRECFQKFTLEGFGDQVKPQIVIRNTLMSGKALKIYSGAFTLACSNGAIRGKKHSVLTHTHMKALDNAPVHELVYDFVHTYPEYTLKLEKMENTPAIPVEFFVDWKLAERDKIQIISMFENRMNNQHANENRRGNSLRDLYETATEYFTHISKVNEAGRIERLAVVDEITDRLLLGVN
jgi:hypothetical protein